MPSQLEIPTIQQLRQSFHNAVRGSKDIQADSHVGSIYDHAAGIGAILWSWEAAKDKDEFESIYFDRTSGQELSDYVLFHDEIDRIEDVYGEGYISVVRPTTSAGSGTFWKGTRITFFENHTSVEYVVSRDTVVAGLDARIPIRATFFGRDSAIDINPSNNTIVRIIDPLWDNTWAIVKMVCSEGTVFEQAEEFKARVKELRKLRRVGYSDIILNKCKEVGAYKIFLLQSDFGGDALDYGINVVYVSDSGYVTTDELRYKAAIALESVRVLGADLLVLPIQKNNISFNIELMTWTDPRNLNSFEVRNSATSYVIDYFNSTSGFSYDLGNIAGQIRKSIPEVVRSVNFITPTVDQSILVNGVYPPILTKYELLPSDIVVSLVGPS